MIAENLALIDKRLSSYLFAYDFLYVSTNFKWSMLHISSAWSNEKDRSLS